MTHTEPPFECCSGHDTVTSHAAARQQTVQFAASLPGRRGCNSASGGVVPAYVVRRIPLRQTVRVPKPARTPRPRPVWQFVGLCATALVVLTGCSEYAIGESTPALTPNAVVGSWTHPGPNGIVAKYEFLSDHTFIATDIPLAHVVSNETKLKIDWTHLMTGGGNWSIEESQDPPILDLTYNSASEAKFDPAEPSINDGHYDELLSVEDNGVIGLFVVVGDADEQFRLVLHKLKH
jgi:hypothetical protein